MSVVPLNGRAVATVVSVIVDPDGASSGTRWQPAAAKPERARTAAARTACRENPVIIKTLNILRP